jgi:hypothetical protein
VNGSVIHFEDTIFVIGFRFLMMVTILFHEFVTIMWLILCFASLYYVCLMFPFYNVYYIMY